MSNFKLTIIEELKDLIPPISEEEYRQLEKNCLKDGIREPLSVWNHEGGYVLIDGHNRHRIATENDLKYSIKEYEFPSISEVKAWIVQNQMGRRNLNSFQRIELALKLKQELAAEAKENQRGGRGGVLLSDLTQAKKRTRKALARIAGVSEGTVHKAEKILASSDEDSLKELRSGMQSIHEAYTRIRYETKEQERKSEIERLRTTTVNMPPGEGVYDVIVVDPPWEYRDTKADAQHLRVRAPYPSMTIEEIKELELPMAENCVIFLWSTQHHLPVAFEVLTAWGCEYRSTIVWDKQSLGMGKTIRFQCEFCLMAYKGRPIIDTTSHTIRDIICSPRREHSRKPDGFYDLVDTICMGRKLDFFSRERRVGWDSYGNDTEHFHNR